MIIVIVGNQDAAQKQQMQISWEGIEPTDVADALKHAASAIERQTGSKLIVPMPVIPPNLGNHHE
jgi:hypothetical protein